MTETTVASFEELHKALEKFTPRSAIFRGVTSANHELLTSIGRMEFFR